MYVLCVVAVSCSLLISALCSQLSKQTSSVVTSPPTISASGQWQLAISANQETTLNVAFIRQDRTLIYGLGQDPLGTYTLEGKLSSDKIWFVKKYDEEACCRGAPRQGIVFDGLLSNPLGNTIVVEGRYETQVKSGFPSSYFKKSQWDIVGGRWSGRKIGELPDQMSMHLDSSRNASWNPLRDLDVQPPNVRQPSVNVETPVATEEQQLIKIVAGVFYCILAAAIAAATGWILLVFYRHLEQ